MTDSDIKSVLGTKKITRSQIESTVNQKTAQDGLRETYTDKELKELADENGYSSFWTGAKTDIARFLESDKAKELYTDILYKQYQDAGQAD